METLKYSFRVDCWIPFHEINSGVIVKKFLSGFDAVFGSHRIFFTINELNLHPMSILIPVAVLKSVDEGDEISFNSKILIVRNFRIFPEKIIDVIAKPDKAVVQFLPENIKLIRKDIKLFGKQSEVCKASFDCLNRENQHNDRLYDCLPRFKDAIINKSLNLSDFSDLIGYGEGLTPSFDDFCTGVLLADRFSNNNFINIYDNFWNIAEKKTTWQSIQQLKFAQVGLLSLAFEIFMKKLMSKQLKSSEIIKLFDYGHFSGTDILAGVCFYLNLLC